MMKREDQEFLRQSMLYARHKDYASMVGQIDAYSRLSRLPIRLLVFTGRDDVFQSFSQPTSSEYQVQIDYDISGIQVGRLTREYGKLTRTIISGRFLLFKHAQEHVYLLISDDSPLFFQQGLSKYVIKKRPRMTIPFFYSWEIESMLARLGKSRPDCQIMLTRVSKKSRLTTGESRKEKETEVRWTDVPYRDVFKEARQSDSWVEKVYFDLLRLTDNPSSQNRQKVISGSISRNGVFRFESGFKDFYETIVEQAVATFSKRTTQLSHRQRTKEAQFAANPLFIEFDSPVFKDKNQNKKLIEAIKHIPYSARSAIHDNPYLHISVIDYLDNSNYDVWILSDNRISIVPQSVCTMNSLNRFCDHISRDFLEGVIKDSKEVDLRLWE